MRTSELSPTRWAAQRRRVCRVAVVGSALLILAGVGLWVGCYWGSFYLSYSRIWTSAPDAQGLAACGQAKLMLGSAGGTLILRTIIDDVRGTPEAIAAASKFGLGYSPGFSGTSTRATGRLTSMYYKVREEGKWGLSYQLDDDTLRWDLAGMQLFDDPPPAPLVQQRWDTVTIPYWLIILLASALPLRAAVHAVRRSRRRRRGQCLACGYDLRASPDRCPECGRATTRGDDGREEPADSADRSGGK